MHATLSVPTTGGPYKILAFLAPVTHEAMITHAVQEALAQPAPTSQTLDPIASFVPPFSRNHGPKGKDGAWLLEEWVTPDDSIAIRWVVASLSPEERASLRILVDLHGESMATGELLPQAGFGPDTYPSAVFKRVAGFCRACGRKPFWHNDSSQGNGSLLSIRTDREVMRGMLDAALSDYGV